jgi:hypothetical protein
MEWKEGQLISCQILGEKGSAGKCKYKNTTYEFSVPENGVYDLVLK